MTMTLFDYATEVSETKLAAYRIKAIADAFAQEYIDSTDFNLTGKQIAACPDSFVYLFDAMHDSLCALCKRLDALEDVKISD